MSFLQTWSARAREVREALGLTQQSMASLLQVAPRAVVGWEGEHPPGPQQLERYARLLGLELEELFQGGVPTQNPVRTLFRSAQESFDGERAFLANDLMPLEAALPVGEFLRAVRRAEQLEGLLGRSGERGPWAQIEPSVLGVSSLQDPKARHNAALEGGRLAESAREVLGLGDDPIPSMVKLLEGLGVWVFATSALPQGIEAAATRAPRAGILVRAAQNTARWRLRVTLAHELCHLLHDRAALGDEVLGGFFGVSLGGDNVWSGRLRMLDLMEVRARSFGASFVAPLPGVRTLLGECPKDEAGGAKAVKLVCDRFGVGKTVAVNQICNAFFESQTGPWLQAREHLTGSDKVSSGHGPRFALDEPLFGVQRHPDFVRLVLEGLERGVLSRAEGWEYLGRRLDEPLVEDPALTSNPRWLKPFRVVSQAQGVTLGSVV